MAGKLRSPAQWVQSPRNGAEFIQTTCFIVRRPGFLVCVLLQFLGQISEKNYSNLKSLPPTQTPFGKLTLPEYRWATLKLLVKKEWCLLKWLGKTSLIPWRGQNSRERLSLWGSQIWEVNVAWNSKEELPGKGSTSSRPWTLKGRHGAGPLWQYKDNKQRHTSWHECGKGRGCLEQIPLTTSFLWEPLKYSFFHGEFLHYPVSSVFYFHWTLITHCFQVFKGVHLILPYLRLFTYLM